MRTLALLGLTWASAASAFAAPAQIIIIRHAEKPPQGNEVDPQGCERAYLLPTFFESDPTVNRYGKPVAVYAAQPDHAGASVRPIQTIAPSASALGLTIQDPATPLDYATIVHDVMSNPQYDGRTVVLAWEHTAIPGLAGALGVPVPKKDRKWPDGVFDEAWALSFNPPSLQIIPERALPGDNPQGGAKWKNLPSANENGIPQDVVQECVNDDTLNALAGSLARPPLPVGVVARAVGAVGCATGSASCGAPVGEARTGAVISDDPRLTGKSVHSAGGAADVAPTTGTTSGSRAN